MKQTIHYLTRLLLSALVLTSIPFCITAQQNVQVQGKVTDATTEKPLEGVNVTAKNATNGSNTSSDGRFQIAVAKGEKITLSFAGYLPQTVTASENFLNIKLVQDAKQLEDVVVTALGVKKEVKRLGYAVQEIKGSDLVKAREPNPINGLVGKVAGLDVAISREILAAPAVSLRGGTITLYVVDGMPITSDTWNISPDDIETYTVLKGLAATALYGSRAQNGAILITTKKGKKNAKGYTIEINSSLQIDKGFIAVPKTQSLYGGGDNSQYSFGDGKGGGINDGDYDVWGPALNGQLLPQYDSPIDPVTGKRKPTPYTARGVNNMKDFIQAGLLNTNNISFSAATDRSSIRMSLSNSNQRGIIPNTKLNIYNFNINTSYDLSSKFKIDGALNYNRQISPNIPDVQYGPNSVIYSMTIWTGADWSINDPNIRNYWQPGKEGVQSNFAEYQRYHNPWFMSYEWLRGHYKTDIFGNIGLTYKANKNLEAVIRGNITGNDVLRNEKMPYSAHPYGREGNRGDYREDRRSLIDNNVEGIVKYNGKLKDLLKVDALAGVNARSFNYNSSFTTTDYLNVPGLYNFGNSLNPVKAYSYNAKMLVLSAYTSISVDVKNYLSLNLSGRVDKSSALRKENNVYYYPSASLATVVSDYIHLPNAISFLKLRTSYATAKAPDVAKYIGPAFYPLGYGAPYVTIFGGPAFKLSDPAYTIGTVYNNQTGAFAPGNKIDPNVQSSKQNSTEFGLDMKFIKNRLGFSATYYSNIIGPNIVNYPLSQTSGLTGLSTNAIKTKLSGVELSLTGAPVQKKDLRWDVLVNWSTYKEVYKDLPSNFETPFVHQGDRVDNLFAKVTAKTLDGQVINNSAGFPEYLKKDQLVGHGDVDFSWAINNKFTYKTLSISFQFDGKVGGIVQDYVRRKGTEGGSYAGTAEGAVGAARALEAKNVIYNPAANRFDVNPGFIGSYIGEGVQLAAGSPAIAYDPVTGVITNMSALKFKPNTGVVAYIQDYVSSFFNNFEHTSVAKTYAKLREVVITYSLPTRLLGKKSYINKVEVSLVGRNLLYFFPSAFHDIDVDQYSGRDINQSNSREPNLQTPTTRSYGVNLNIVF